MKNTETVTIQHVVVEGQPQKAAVQVNERTAKLLSRDPLYSIKKAAPAVPKEVTEKTGK